MSPPRKRRRQQYSDQRISLASGNNLKQDFGPSLQPEIPDSELVKKDEPKISYTDSKNEGGSNVTHNKSHLSCSNTFISDPEASENEDEDEDENEDVNEDDDEDESEDESDDQDESEDQNGDRYLAKLRNEMEVFERGRESQVQKAYLALEAACKLDETIPIVQLKEGRWELHSSEYLAYYFEEVHRHYLFTSKCHFDSEGNEQECGPGQISAELTIYPEGFLSLYPIILPSQATLEPVTVKSSESDQTFEIIFLGGKYIKLKVELKVLMGTRRSQGSSYNSKMIEFSGIWISNEERGRQQKQETPPSPKQSMASQLMGWDSD